MKASTMKPMHWLEHFRNCCRPNPRTQVAFSSRKSHFQCTQKSTCIPEMRLKPPWPQRRRSDSCADVCSSALLIPAILGCERTEPPLKPLSEFAEPNLCEPCQPNGARWYARLCFF
jgi:hypothetical protein